MSFSYDCRLFSGYRPCRNQSRCDDCSSYSPMGTRIAIIKLGAIGDALRTTPVIEGLRKKYPESYITWITDEASYPLLKGIPAVDRLMILNFETSVRLAGETFDILVNFDKDPLALGMASMLKAHGKQGFCCSEEGKVSIYGGESSYAYQIGLFDDLKFKRNTLSYQEIIFPMAGLQFAGEEYALNLTAEEEERGRDFLRAHSIGDDRLIIGLNTGCGEVFATKKWTVEGFVELSEMLVSRLDAAIVLLGGPSERERNRDIEKRLSFTAYNSGNDNSLREFSSLIKCCHMVVTADTTALHIALALKVPVVALFGSTCHQEIYLYGRGEKVISGYPCSPCYKNRCSVNPGCMDALKAETVYDAIVRLAARSGLSRGAL